MSKTFETTYLAFYYPPSQLRKVPSACMTVSGIVYEDGEDCVIRKIIYNGMNILPVVRCSDLFEKIEEHFINQYNEIKNYEPDSHTYDD